MDGFYIIGYEKPEQYFKQSCILLHPAIYDSFPVAVLEAMASGLIPIISDRTGSAEILKEYYGKLVLKLDPELISERIIDILTMPLDEKVELSQKIRRKALNPLFRKEISIHRFRKSLINILRSNL